MKRFRTYPFFVVLSLLFVISILSSCVKTKPTTVTIYVKNPNGTMSQGAAVRLFGQPATYTSSNASQELRIDLTGTTDAEGKVFFDLTDFYEAGQTGMAILNVDGLKSNLEFSELIQVIEQEPNEATFFLH